MSRNLYADLGMFQARYADNQTLDTSDASGIERVLDASSRRVDHVTRRHYYPLTATRVFPGSGSDRIRLPDLLAATAVKLDEDGDRTFELTLDASEDYYLERHGYEDADGTPKTMIRLDGVNGQRSAFLRRKRLLQIAGRWGYTEDTEDTGATVGDNPYTAGATTLNVTAGGGALLAVGQTLVVGTEQLYVSAITTDALTVVPAVNGTTAANHVQTTAISRLVYVPSIREATLILASRVWKRRDTAYANVIANPVVGTFETFRRTDPDAAELLAEFVRGDVLVA